MIIKKEDKENSDASDHYYIRLTTVTKKDTSPVALILHCHPNLQLLGSPSYSEHLENWEVLHSVSTSRWGLQSCSKRVQPFVLLNKQVYMSSDEETYGFILLLDSLHSLAGTQGGTSRVSLSIYLQTRLAIWLHGLDILPLNKGSWIHSHDISSSLMIIFHLSCIFH